MPPLVKLGKVDERGRYRKSLGLKAIGGSQAVFYLGTERAAAERASIRLDAVWSSVEKRWAAKGRPTPKPLWDAISLKIGQAVAAGKEEVSFAAYELPPVKGRSYEEEVRNLWKEIATLSGDFPTIRIKLEEEEFADDGKAEMVRERAEIDKLLNTSTANTPGGPMLHAALDQWAERQVKKYEGRSEHGRKQQHRAEFVKRLFEDAPLSTLTNDKIQEMLDTIAKRPTTKLLGREEDRCSRDFAQSLLKAVRSFVDWLDTTGDWTKPKGYKVKPIKIVRLASDRVKGYSVPIYRRSELQALWEYATPLERVYLAFALNCGMGSGELCTLRSEEIHLAKDTGKKGSYVKRFRAKTGIYGEWKLWPETVQAIEWYRATINSSEKGVFIYVDGEPIEEMQGNHRNPYFRNKFNKLIDRIRKDKPQFKRLSFGKVKKSGATLVESEGGPVMASYHIAHGKATDDKLLSDYVNRKFRRLFKVHSRVRRLLAKVFAAVPEPFPPQTGGRHSKRPSLSVETIQAMKTMRAEGVPYAVIAEKLGVSFDTIRRYTAKKRAKNEQETP